MFNNVSNKNQNTTPQDGENSVNEKLASSNELPAKIGAGKVDDIFSETDKSRGQEKKIENIKSVPLNNQPPSRPDIFQPKQKVSPGQDGSGDLPPASLPREKTGGNNKLIILGGIIIALAVIISGGFWAFNKFINKANIITNPQGAEDIDSGPIGKFGEESSGVTPGEEQLDDEVGEPDDLVAIPSPKDSDSDGLTDEEEKKLGTDINNVDSDDDGLFDREEVKVYKTDPLNADSDNDGYLDGEEVKQGLNPKGSGKLYSIPGQVEENEDIDSDGDGLLDNEEVKLNTNINNTDSDSDNLSDYQEVKVYMTDPNNPDTDGDSYLDGDEVENGYNPKGEGKLVD
ncbi:MAG: binary toxin-like calcium binding domain-containing protein [Patescibacteria group bacterium]